ncbi:hypothetical protein MPTK1_4g19010 [Marchantia polymorpha subsp. ruderalis]|uniref:Fucosyltransferase n=2 Tax=Marchantia polymorpha TaxID=3197 RepID=A0AAF6BBF8_MARPO|nr:hypothetical protein MARPO_0164s0009 [Marchantia polymorpha]BBN09342.1 hypothetical protein Mp_4g19010 [Marchantia polymorpha subsp. ruderalis]|eukprot:PTQ28413.1 hypothetical protein MARPO_0164s0009 [Marchantia polymorpha]
MAVPTNMRTGAVLGGRRRWTKWIQWIIIVVVLGEMVFLLHLDQLNGEYFNFKSFAALNFSLDNDVEHRAEVIHKDDSVNRSNNESCEEWLEKNDFLGYGRNFSKSPIHVAFGENQVWDSCAVGCKFRSTVSESFRPDGVLRAASGLPSWMEKESCHILRSMESSSYYPENDLTSARKRGYDVVMTTSLESEVPVGYFSWAEYDLMSPVSRKTEGAYAAAFISNCGAHNFRLEALEGLKAQGVRIDSYGQCLRTREGRGVNKLQTLRRYKFSLAFENSNEDDYVTEKFWQSLVAGSVPVVVGAPNIDNFSPAPNALLHIKSLNDIPAVARQIKYLASNFTAYNETLRWKYYGPTDGFKALVDMAAVHSSCRLCIHIATKIRSREEKQLAATLKKPRPCKCTDKFGVITYHLFVRERGRFQLHSVFLKSTNLTTSGLKNAVFTKFKSLNHVPIWWDERPAVIRGDGTLKIHTLYPVGLNQRKALYTPHFHTDVEVSNYVEANPCPYLEVIFV